MPGLNSDLERDNDRNGPSDASTISTFHPICGDEIRILVLQPSKEQDSPLQCRLETCSLSGGSMPYEALSYTWGPPVDSCLDAYEQIELCDRTNTIKLNLAEALRQFRRTRRHRRLWVDALCIDQNNPAERSQQVAMMAHIYAKAFRVLIWVGKDDEANTGTIAVTFCRAIFKRPPPSRRDDQPAEDLWSNWLYDLEDDLAPVKDLLTPNRGSNADHWIRLRDLHQQVIPALATFSRRRYFKRRWVLQEIFNAQSTILYCGAATIPWYELQQAYTSLLNMDIYDAYFQLDAVIRPLPSVYSHATYAGMATRTGSDRRHDNSARPVIHRLVAFQEAECSNSLDRVYSLSAFGPGEAVLNVDYSIAPTTLWKQVARALVQEGFPTIPLEIAANQYLNSKQGLPSWIPDPNLPLSINYNRDWGTPFSETAIMDDQDNLHIGLFCLAVVASHDGHKVLRGHFRISNDVFDRFVPRSFEYANGSSLHDGDLIVSTRRFCTSYDDLTATVLRPNKTELFNISERELSYKVVGAIPFLQAGRLMFEEARMLCIT